MKISRLKKNNFTIKHSSMKYAMTFCRRSMNTFMNLNSLTGLYFKFIHSKTELNCNPEGNKERIYEVGMGNNS